MILAPITPAAAESFLLAVPAFRLKARCTYLGEVATPEMVGTRKVKDPES